VTSSATPSNINNDKLDEVALLAKLYKVMCSLHGEARAQFEYLMDTVAQRNETIDELNTHIEDGVRRYNLLKQELSDEKNTSFMLSQQIETYEKDKVKNLDTLDRSLIIAQELDFSKKELEAAHASLTKDLEHLEVTSKLVKCELLKLREDHDQLQVIHNEVLGTINDPILVDDITCASNSSFVQASRVDENKKGLDNVLAQQKTRTPKQGLGYNPRKNKKNVTPPKKFNFVQEGHKINENGKKSVGIGKVTKGNPNHHFAGEFNPSYVLCKGTNGNVYAKYVGPRNEYAYSLYCIWVPKVLVTNVKGPIAKWVPKCKT
jgi:hypothetical protein